VWCPESFGSGRSAHCRPTIPFIWERVRQASSGVLLVCADGRQRHWSACWRLTHGNKRSNRQRDSAIRWLWLGRWSLTVARVVPISEWESTDSNTASAPVGNQSLALCRGWYCTVNWTHWSELNFEKVWGRSTREREKEEERIQRARLFKWGEYRLD